MRALFFAILVLAFADASAHDTYRVTLLRAPPGALPELIESIREYRAARAGQVLVMRHSQGDHWDLMLMERAGETPTANADFRELAVFQHAFLAESVTPWSEILARGRESGLFHVEMFHADAGKLPALLDQRQMENDYLVATGRKANALFVTTFGSDVDCFTVGFYRDLAHFAEAPELPDDALESAARDAGFAARNDIGFHLRRTIVAHHDTLAVAVD